MQTRGALVRYLENLSQIEGWFQADAALLFMAYAGLNTAEGITGDTLEIGVHHGRSAIAVASLRGDGRNFWAVDLFDTLQCFNVSCSGKGSEKAFRYNMASYYGDLSFLRTIKSASANLTPADLGDSFSFCHIDGGHSAEETYHDLELCWQITLPGGLIVLDDYFHPGFPGVSEGAIRFMLDHSEALIPLWVGFNKVLFQKTPAPFDLNRRFVEPFRIPKSVVTFWSKPAFFFEEAVVPLFDLAASTPTKLVQEKNLVGAGMSCRVKQINAGAGETISIPIEVVNTGHLAWRPGKNPFALSYHLMSKDGQLLRFDNPRSTFPEEMQPGRGHQCELSVRVPDTSDCYRLEIDMVWEGVLWFKDQGVEALTIDLVVK
jgi:hypothetical protein